MMETEDNRSTTASTKPKSRSGKAKVFQCQGYGDCRMVFTRSEHLARHMRKHTGEKPFKCIVSGCDRMFSRFDNMMQHTQTHNKSRGRARRTSKSRKPKGGRRGQRMRSTSTSSYEDEEDDKYAQLPPSPPISRRGSTQEDLYRRRSRGQSQYAMNDDDDDDGHDDGLEDQDSDASYQPFGPGGPQPSIKEQHKMYSEMRRMSQDETLARNLPPLRVNHGGWYHPKDSYYPDSPVTPDSPQSSSEETTDYYSYRRIHRVAPKVYYHPYPGRPSYDERQVLRPIIPRPDPSDGPISPRDPSILPRLASYLVSHPDEPPENYLLHQQGQQESQAKEDSASEPGSQMKETRRLSVQDLCNPIECLENQTAQPNSEEEGVNLTIDEFEAIQGFGRFHAVASTVDN